VDVDGIPVVAIFGFSGGDPSVAVAYVDPETEVAVGSAVTRMSVAMTVVRVDALAYNGTPLALRLTMGEPD
jgi:hypothetical protein